MQDYARVCQSISEYASVCQSIPEYARVCQCMPEMPKICPQREENTLWPYVIHGIITEMCDIIIYKRGPLSVTHTMRGSPERSEHYEGVA